MWLQDEYLPTVQNIIEFVTFILFSISNISRLTNKIYSYEATPVIKNTYQENIERLTTNFPHNWTWTVWLTNSILSITGC